MTPEERQSSPRILVVTMHTEENEFRDCIASVERQSLKCAEHLIISGLSAAHAHERAYSYFYTNADKFDIMVKVDADMVLSNTQLFENIAREFQERPDMSLLAIEVYDWMTGRPVQGLNSYRNGHPWTGLLDGVFLDRTSIDRQRIVTDATLLAPAAVHCGNPSPFQAFHFGLHRGLKVRYAVRAGQLGSAFCRLEDLDALHAHATVERDPRLWLACLGGEIALAAAAGRMSIDYTDAATRRAYEQVAGLAGDKVRTAVRVLRRRNFRVLPPELWLQWMASGGPIGRLRQSLAVIPVLTRRWMRARLDSLRRRSARFPPARRV